MFAKDSFMFSNEYGINEGANAIVRTLDDRIAISEPRWTGISICLVDEFGEPVDAHICATAGRCKNRRVLGYPKLVGDSFVWLLTSGATGPGFPNASMKSAPLGAPLDPNVWQHTDSSWSAPTIQ